MNRIIILSLLAVTLVVTTISVDVYAFDPTQVNMTINDVQTASFPEFDVLTLFLSFFNNNTEDVTISGYNMLYLNDTNANYWELSTDVHIDGITNTCPQLNSTIPSGQSEEMQICFVIPKSHEIGYSLILNNEYYMMDMEIEEFTMEMVPESFKNTSSQWCNDQVSDSEYFTLLQNEIQQRNISVLRGVSGIDDGAAIPDWVKNTACDYSNDVINQYQFLDGIYWLIDNGKVVLD